MKRRHFLASLAASGLLRGMDKSKDAMIVRSTRPQDLEMPLDGFLEEITPNDRFFVRTHDYAPAIDLREWRLRITGSVQKDAVLSLEDIKNLPKVEVTAVLECAGNGRSLYEPPSQAKKTSGGNQTTYRPRLQEITLD